MFYLLTDQTEEHNGEQDRDDDVQYGEPEPRIFKQFINKSTTALFEQLRATERNTCLHVLLALGVPSLQCDLRYTQKLTDPEQVFFFQNAEDFQIVFDNINNVKISFLEVDDEDVHLVVGRMHRQDVRSVWAKSTSHYLDLKFQNNSFIVKKLNLSNYLDLKCQNNFFAFISLNLSASRPV